jgi:hypothetical protein
MQAVQEKVFFNSKTTGDETENLSDISYTFILRRLQAGPVP